MNLVSRRNILWGVSASVGLAAIYALIVGIASGSGRHLLAQVETDWYLLTPLILGFGLQISLVLELRRRHQLQATTAAAGTAGAGASTVGMVACCAHHVADLAPFIGATGAATFLIEYRLPFILGGLGITTLGVLVAALRLARLVRTDGPVTRAWAA